MAKYVTNLAYFIKCMSYMWILSVVSSGKMKTDFNRLMERTTTQNECLSLVSGGGGVGKSHLIAMFLELEPPSLRVSTPCAKMPLYTTKITQVTKRGTQVLQKSTSFYVLTDEKYTEMMIKSGKESTSSLPSKSWIQKITASAKSVVRPRTRATTSEVDKHLCTVMCTGADDVESLDGKFLGRIIDIGGQPQFLELLPRFISGMSYGIVVIDLSQDLTDYPIIYFYGEDGKPVGEGVSSNLTNEQLFRFFLQMIVSQSSRNKDVKVIIVGTHRDVEYKSNESRKAKEGKLQEIVASFQLEKNIVYTDETHNNVIFAVNAKTPEAEDRVISRNIMDVIMDEEHAETRCIPLKYHNLELTLKEIANSKKVAVSFKNVFDQVSRYYNNHKEMKDGLIFLNNTFHIFYFKEFPDLIFGEPQLLLNLMTDIVVRHIELATNPGKQGVFAVWKFFKEHAIITESILKEINDVYDDTLTPAIMLEVLEVLLIVFKVNPGEYIMPSLLTATKALPLPASHSISMLFYFPLGLARFGIYCSTVCKLVSSYCWKLYSESLLYRNSFQFIIPNGDRTVTLNDSFDSFFQVVVDVPSKFPVKFLSTICREIRGTLMGVISEVTQDLRYTPDQPVAAFLCSYEHNPAMPTHAAKYTKEGDYLLCTKDNMAITEVTDKQRLWLQGRFNISYTRIILKFNEACERKECMFNCFSYVQVIYY